MHCRDASVAEFIVSPRAESTLSETNRLRAI
jgi:hypothetical protein